MTATEKAVTAALKNIGTALHTIGAGLILELPREYSIAKANYFYGKAGKDVEEWLTKIDQMIEANNVTNRRRVTVATTHLRDATTEWYEQIK